MKHILRPLMRCPGCGAEFHAEPEHANERRETLCAECFGQNIKFRVIAREYRRDRIENRRLA